jgi:hypothetical protein
MNIFLPWRSSPSGPRHPHCRGFTITLRHTTLSRTLLDEWSVRRRNLYLTTQHSQQTDTHAPGEIRTHNPSKRAAADLRFRSLGHWDWPTWNYWRQNMYIFYTFLKTELSSSILMHSSLQNITSIYYGYILMFRQLYGWSYTCRYDTLT